MATLLMVIMVLSYIDRQAFPSIVQAIEREIPISDQQFSRLGFAFLITYAVMYVAGGRLVDAVGTRLGYAVMIGWWSLATFLSGLASSVMGLGACRAALGVGEGGCFPASGKALAEWFPAKERSAGFGLVNAGASIGAVVAVPLLTAVAVHLGWRWVFFSSGVLGCSLGVLWWVKYRPPHAHARLGAAERAYIAAGEPSEAQAITRWRDLLWRREVWGLMLAKALTDSAWSFLTTWLPRYLANERGYDLTMIGAVAWIPYACAGGGSVVGGALGSWLIHRGASVHRSRRICLLLAACLMPATLAIVAMPTSIAIACFSVGLFAHQVWSSNLQAQSADLFPVSLVGSVMGLMGCAGAAVGAVFQLIAGDFIGRRGYGVPFAFTGTAYLIAFFGLVFLAPKAGPTGMGTQRT